MAAAITTAQHRTDRDQRDDDDGDAAHGASLPTGPVGLVVETRRRRRWFAASIVSPEAAPAERAPRASGGLQRHDQQRQGRAMHQVIGGRAEQQAGELRLAAGAHGDDVGLGARRDA